MRRQWGRRQRRPRRAPGHCGGSAPASGVCCMCSSHATAKRPFCASSGGRETTIHRKNHLGPPFGALHEQRRFAWAAETHCPREQRAGARRRALRPLAGGRPVARRPSGTRTRQAESQPLAGAGRPARDAVCRAGCCRAGCCAPRRRRPRQPQPPTCRPRDNTTGAAVPPARHGPPPRPCACGAPLCRRACAKTSRAPRRCF